MKKKTFIVQLLDSKKPNRKSFTQVEDANFYSNDTDASLVFIPHEDSFDFQSAKVVMYNRSDESLVERDAVVTTENGRKVVSYELPAEIIAHWGDWTAQPVFISGGEIYSGSIVPFSVFRYLMHERPPKLSEIVSVTNFIQQSQALVDTMEQEEAQRVTQEQARQIAEQERVRGYQEIKQIIEDGTLSLEPADGSVTTEKLADDSVSPDKTTFFDISKNLWNKSTAERDISVSPAGEIISEEGRMLGDFVPVTPGEIISYDGSYVRNIYYTKDKQFISRVGVGATTNFTVPSLTNIGYVRFSPPELIADTFMINRGASLLPYEEGSATIKPVFLPKNESLNRTEVTNIVTGRLAPLEREISKVSTVKNMLKVDGDGDFTFLLEIADGEYAAHRFKRDAVEDFIKKYEESIYTKEKSTTFSNYDWRNESDMIGTLPGEITNNQYTTTVGKEINFNFEGNQITMRYPSRYDGGMWRATIDGVFVKNISTRSTSTSVITKEEILTKDLESGQHTLTLEFMGDDPNNPATTVDLVTPTTPRGWISADAATTNDARKTFKIVKVSDNITKRFDLTSGFSNKEFAFEVEKTKDEGSQWFPAHFGIATTNKGDSGFQYLLLDGKEIDLDNPSSDLIPFSKAQFVQVLESKRTDDAEVRAKIKLVMTIEGAKMKQSFEIEFLQDTFIRNAYAFMIPTLNTYLGQMVTDRSERLLANTSDLGTSTFAENKNVSRIIATSNNEGMKDYYLRVDLSQDDLVINNLYLQHRSDGIHQKLYLKTHSQHQALAGDIFQVEGTWEVNRLKNANAVYG